VTAFGGCLVAVVEMVVVVVEVVVSLYITTATVATVTATVAVSAARRYYLNAREKKTWLFYIFIRKSTIQLSQNTRKPHANNGV